MKTLEQLREEITQTDVALLRLFDLRMRLASQVAEVKAAIGKAVLDPAREEAVLAHARQHSENPDAAAELMKTVMRLSRERQRDHARGGSV